MEIQPRRFMELAVHVKLLSEAVLEAARNLSAMHPEERASGACQRIMDELIAMNVEIAFMERILRTTACGDDVALARGRTVADG